MLLPHTEVREEPLSHVSSPVDVACLSGGVQPALAPRWTERACPQTWCACPGVCSLPWPLSGRSVHVHGRGACPGLSPGTWFVCPWPCSLPWPLGGRSVHVRGRGACPGPSVGAACTSVAVQPALAPRWAQRARPWPWSLPWLVPGHVVCVSVAVEPVLGLVAVTRSLCESAPPSCPADAVGAATLASCPPPLLREALGRDVRRQPRVGSESLAPSPRGPSRPSPIPRE